MDLFQALNELRAMRRLKPDPVPEALLREVVEFGTRAPSGSNAQGWRFIVTDPALKAQIGACYAQAVDFSFAMIPVGYPQGRFGPTHRRPLDEVLAWNHW